MNIKSDWIAPHITPIVPKGTEQLCVIATRSVRYGVVHEHTRLAYYQNRPLEYTESGELLSDDNLVNTSGEEIESIGWVNCNEHHEFEDYYSPIEFSDDYELVAWAKLDLPTYPKSFVKSLEG